MAGSTFVCLHALLEAVDLCSMIVTRINVVAGGRPHQLRFGVCIVFHITYHGQFS